MHPGLAWKGLICNRLRRLGQHEHRTLFKFCTSIGPGLLTWWHGVIQLLTSCVNAVRMAGGQQWGGRTMKLLPISNAVGIMGAALREMARRLQVRPGWGSSHVLERLQGSTASLPGALDERLLQVGLSAWSAA